MEKLLFFTHGNLDHRSDGGCQCGSRTPVTRNRNPVKNHTALTQVLAWFGSTRIPQNLNQLAKAANSGTLPVTPDTEAALQAVCREIMDVCRLIRKALGFAV